jgi:hypothetical protein
MATTSKAMARTAAATSSATLYTVPSGTTSIVTDISLANAATTASTVTIALDSVVLVPAVSIPANSIINIGLKQTLAATKVISGFASTTAVSIHISGVEVA